MGASLGYNANFIAHPQGRIQGVGGGGLGGFERTPKLHKVGKKRPACGREYSTF